MSTTGLLQNRINELNSAILNYVDNKVYLTGFYNEEMLNKHLEQKKENFSSKGIYDNEDINFYNIKDNALFIVQYEGVTVEKYQFTFLYKKLVKYKNKPGTVTINVRKNVFKEQYNLFTDVNSYGFNSKSELITFIQNEFKEEIEISLLENMDFIAIDFETATSKYSSACSMGLIFVKNHKIVDEKYYLINPPNNKVDNSNTKVHGLTAEDLKNAPSFYETWSEIKDFFNSDTYVVAHNAIFDMNVLKNCLLHYDLEIPKFKYFCSIPFGTRACYSTGVGRSLEDRAAYFGINIEEAHNSLNDARAVAEMVIRCMGIKNENSIDNYLLKYDVPVNNFSDFKHSNDFIKNGTSKFAGKKLGNVESNVEWFDTSHPLFSQQIVFTGDLTSLDRKSAAQAAANLGAIVKNGVTRSTNYLVVGIQDPKLVGKKGVSTKEVKAAELIEKGFEIQILNEDQFIDLVEYEVPEELQQPISKSELQEKERLKKEEKERLKQESEMWWV